MNVLLLFLLATVPALIICILIIQADKHEKEDKLQLLLALLSGAIITIPAFYVEAMAHNAGWEEPTNISKTILYSFLAIGGVEELLKALALVLLFYPRRFFNEPFDGILYSVMIGMGFALVENYLYAYRLGDVSNLVVRAFTAVPAHASFGIIMGYFAGKAKFDSSMPGRRLVLGFLLAALIHGAYDFFILYERYEWLGGLALVCLVLSVFYARRLIKLHQQNSPFKEQA
ncbi:MAG: PrsW family intramembrane metalloprotease [Saprospiraceae bacterium]|nr:PrsW family intramembrane metalloprotease [Saprospiraceae bacterium]